MDDTSDKEHLETLGEEWDEDGANHDDHAANHGLLVANPFGDIAVDDQTEDATNLWQCQFYSFHFEFLGFFIPEFR